MAADTIIQVLTVTLGVLGIIWHQQHTTNKLRDDTTGAINKLRDDTTGAINKLRDDNARDHEALRAAVVRNGERIARIEGHLRMPPPDAPPPDDDPS